MARTSDTRLPGDDGPNEPAGRGSGSSKGVMSFGEHLEELRSCSIRALVGLMAAVALSLIFAERILKFIMQPALVVLDAHGQRAELQALSPPDTFMMYLKMALLSGLIIAMPWILLQIWRFVSLGLYTHERRFLRLFTPFSLGLFVLGVTFMFYIVLPVVLNFFVAFGERMIVPDLQPNLIQSWVIGTEEKKEAKPPPPSSPGGNIPLLKQNPEDPELGSVWINTTRKLYCVQTERGVWSMPLQPEEKISAVRSQFALDFYVSFVLMLSLAFGLAFELPLVILFITGMEIATPEQLGKARRYVILGIVTAAAILTPPDVISQLLLAIPMIILFEGALVLAKMFRRRKEQEKVSGTNGTAGR